jgi:hypothetical protein
MTTIPNLRPRRDLRGRGRRHDTGPHRDESAVNPRPASTTAAGRRVVTPEGIDYLGRAMAWERRLGELRASDTPRTPAASRSAAA